MRGSWVSAVLAGLREWGLDMSLIRGRTAHAPVSIYVYLAIIICLLGDHRVDLGGQLAADEDRTRSDTASIICAVAVGREPRGDRTALGARPTEAPA